MNTEIVSSTATSLALVGDNEWRLAEAFVKSGFFNDARDAAQAIVKIQAGRELGYGPMASMQGIYIVKGKVSLSANLLGATIKRSGRYDYRVTELTDSACSIDFFQHGEPIGSSTFTLEDAKRAGLLNSQTWKAYARNMLFARALSNGARWYCPDVFGGPLYTPEELGAEVDGETGEPIAAKRNGTGRVPAASNGHSDAIDAEVIEAEPATEHSWSTTPRPWPAPVTYEAVNARAATLADKMQATESSSAQRTAAAIRSREVWGEDDAEDFRHATLRALFDEDSITRVTEAQAAAWLGWLGTPEAKAEAEALVDWLSDREATEDATKLETEAA